jgi:hypothetical protein
MTKLNNRFFSIKWAIVFAQWRNEPY